MYARCIHDKHMSALLRVEKKAPRKSIFNFSLILKMENSQCVSLQSERGKI